ncbi:MAG: hypothetical protein IT372_07285 [Polyangiaceae bacterium]|nr:hypothetical protein [Polyangiaceae bacterium]
MPPRTSDALKQLNNALAQIKSANAILDSVAAGWSVPDAPEQPPYIDTLSTIKIQASHSIDVANRLLATMGK